MVEAVMEVVEDMVVEDTAKAEGAGEPAPAAVGAEILDILLSRVHPALVPWTTLVAVVETVSLSPQAIRSLDDRWEEGPEIRSLELRDMPVVTPIMSTILRRGECMGIRSRLDIGLFIGMGMAIQMNMGRTLRSLLNVLVVINPWSIWSPVLVSMTLRL
jgi:hypothetical protein